MKIFLLFISFTTTFLICITLNSSNITYAETSETPIVFQFLTSTNQPIPNETFQLQLDNETKSLTTKSDGLAIIQIPNASLKKSYVLTTSNQQTFTVEPNKLYRLTSSHNTISTPSNINSQNISINVISNTYQQLNNIEVKLIGNNQEFTGKTNQNGQVVIEIPANIPRDTLFNVQIQGVDTKSTIKIGEDKYYTYSSNNKQASLHITNNTSPQAIVTNNNPNDTNHFPNQTDSLNNSQSNTQNTNHNYQISIVKDNLTSNNSKTTETEQKDTNKKALSEKKTLPDTGQNNHIIKYIFSTLFIAIATTIFFILKRKRTQKQN